MNKIVKLLTVIILVVSAGTFSACKKSFDNPPGATDPNIVANTTIETLKAMHTVAGAYDIITTDMVISGVVVADDKSGNFYKQLYIQDATGGLQILLDANSLYGTYPVGRRIFIKCKGLCISDYNGTMELGVKATVGGLPSVEGIPGNLISNYIVGGSINNPVVPTVVTLNQLTTGMQDKYLGTLIQLDGYEFGDTTVTYSDTSAYKSTVNLDIKNCSGSTVIIRTSAYANFAAQRVARGNGSVVAIYTTYGTTKQLIIRDQYDVKFNGNRCNLFEEDFNSIGANGATLALPGWRNIQEVGSSPNSLYQNAVFGSGPTKCAKVSAFSTGGTATTWLITPAISLAGLTTPKLGFYTSAGFISAVTPQFRVYISTTYPGSGTPSTYFTTQLPATIATPPASGFSSFIYSGQISLAAYAGQTVYIAFRYDGNDPSGTGSDATATYEVDNVGVTRQ
ncbi:MAG: choice-of-anchor J domain-containing protein [Chitinophagaceae bacterium]|nr:choice-of-anchor J domain-containing protein [Chitinophagaceae bacterium]MBL0056042.1 choice-of-anchor J domain-containing protein [Chitinophagaceae bacterium]